MSESQGASSAEDSGLVEGTFGSGNRRVRKRESVSSIAWRAGHFWETVWDDPANKELREARENPNALVTGDRVHVPPLRENEVDGASETKHRFVRKGVPATLRMTVRDFDEPKANEPFRVTAEREVVAEGTTDGEGYLEAKLSPGVTALTLIVGEGETELIYHLNVGSIAPANTLEGFRARLVNLGYTMTPRGTPIDDDFRAQVRAFQKAEDLDETGFIDKATVDALKAHGV